jgi:hypothetical protein
MLRKSIERSGWTMLAALMAFTAPARADISILAPPAVRIAEYRGTYTFDFNAVPLVYSILNLDRTDTLQITALSISNQFLSGDPEDNIAGLSYNPSIGRNIGPLGRLDIPVTISLTKYGAEQPQFQDAGFSRLTLTTTLQDLSTGGTLNGSASIQVEVFDYPEPSSILLFGIGAPAVFGCALLRRRSQLRFGML